MPDDRFWRDSSGRLTFDLADVTAADYPAACRALADAFTLTQGGPFCAGLDHMFWDFRRGEQVVGLDWDVWMGLMVVAQTERSEALLREIAAWLSSSKWAGDSIRT